MTQITVLRRGPLATIQDKGRFGMLAHGISASGPMDRTAFSAAGAALPRAGGAGIEFSQSFSFTVDGLVTASFSGGSFQLRCGGKSVNWPAVFDLVAGDVVDITPGPQGNYGYVRFSRELDVPVVLGSQATNVTVGLGGWKGRPLREGDRIELLGEGAPVAAPPSREYSDDPIRVVWGIHADLYPEPLRNRFTETAFTISRSLDRMGVRLMDEAGLFADQRKLDLVSDPIVPGDIQILGDGTPIVLMRDHQPTGGYPRIATIIVDDLDRFAQMRPGATVRFRPVRAEV